MERKDLSKPQKTIYGLLDYGSDVKPLHALTSERRDTVGPRFERLALSRQRIAFPGPQVRALSLG